MTVKDGLKYTNSHEWIHTHGKTASIGITDYAQDSLGDIVYVELPEPGCKVSKGDETANIESSKVARAIYSPLSGKILEANISLNEEPRRLNQEPYGVPLFILEFFDESEINSYMNADAYKKLLGL